MAGWLADGLRGIAGHLRWALIVLLPEPRADRDALRRRLTDPLLNEDARRVIEAAGMLDVSEYRFLVIAYEDKFGRRPPPEEIDRVFGPYMFVGRTPYWAKSVAREIIALYERGELARSRFRGTARPPPTVRDVIHAVGECLLLVAVLGIIFVMFATYQPL